MFIGSINSKVRDLLFDNREIFRGRQICVGCSGNFTIEQILSGVDCRVHSNDISLYTSLIGNHLAKQPMTVKIADPKYSWLDPFMTGSLETIAAVSLLFEMLKYEKRNNLQQIRLFKHYCDSFASFHEASCERISKNLEKIKIEKYTAMDVHDLYRDLPNEWIRIAFLPTYIGGYERLYKRLEEIISWAAPAYEVLTEERHEETVGFMKRGEYCYLADYDRDEEGLISIIKTGRGKAIYLYSNLPIRTSYIARTSVFEATNYERLPVDYEISPDSKIRLIVTSNKRMNFYKNIFLKKGIEYVDGRFCVLVFLDDYLFGFLIFDVIRYGMDQEKAVRGVYMLSDFVVNSRIKRLSKLLLLVTKTKELRRMLSKKFLSSADFILTTAFTDKPVSMKYRGMYKLLKRGEGFLQYMTDCGTLSLNEVIETWKKKK